MAINIRGNKVNIRGTVIAMEPVTETITFCTVSDDGSQLLTSSSSYKIGPFDQDFFDQLGKILAMQKQTNPNMDLQRATLLLPDQLFLLDMVSIPVIHRKAMQHSLSLAIESVYKNASELNLMTYPVQQNKQSATFGLVGIRQDLLDAIRQAFANCGVTITGVTYASNAMVNGAMVVNPKLRSESFLLMDIKENLTRFAFVVRGCTMGYFDLPFGHVIMRQSYVSAEDTLFDHRAGELLVLNAKERARAKNLTLEGSFAPDGDIHNPIYETGETKTGRKLPKFMQRNAPETKEDCVYENFRIFLKWALDLISGNREIVGLASLDTVYVNMPTEYNFLYKIVSRKHAGRNVTFAPLTQDETDRNLLDNLELCGGYFLNRFNEANTF